MDLGEPVKRYTVIPLTEPVRAPEPTTPAPKPHVPAKAPEKVPP